MQETCNFDVLYAYLVRAQPSGNVGFVAESPLLLTNPVFSLLQTCGNYDFQYDRSKSLRPKRNVRTAMNHEIMMYGIAQKEQSGFDKAVEECKYRMSRYGVTPNMLIMPPQMLLYMALAPESKLTYALGGPNAEARFEAGMAGFEARAFRGCGIMTSEPFEVSDDQDSVQMLTRNSQVGEFYIMQPPQVDPGKQSENKHLYTSDMLIYDEESDRHVRITWGDALAAACVKDLDMTTALEHPTKLGQNTLVKWQNAALKIQAYNEGKKYVPDANNPNTVEGTIVAAVNPGDVPVYGSLDRDIRIVVARPFIEHQMHNAILTVSGRDTGATLFGPADMQLSANTQVKTIEGAPQRACTFAGACSSACSFAQVTTLATSRL